MKIKGVRILKNGVKAGYVKQKDGKWKFRFLKKKKKIVGGEYIINKDIEIEKIELPHDLYDEILYIFQKFVPTIENNKKRDIFFEIYNKLIINLKKEKNERLESARKYVIPRRWNEMNKYEPIKVKYSFSTGNYELIDGRHRLFKLILLGKEKVNAYVTLPT